MPSAYNKGKGKGKTDTCYKCGQQGHISKYDMGDLSSQDDPTSSPTYNCYNDPQQHDPLWWNQDITQQGYGQQQLALPPSPQQQPTGTAQAINVMEEILIAAIDSIQKIGVTTTNSFEEIMNDSGAAAHVCPPWFGTPFPLHHMNDAPSHTDEQ